MAPSLKLIFPLNPTHETHEFDCGNLVLNQWLADYSLKAARSNSAITYVAVVNNKVIAYYSLAAGEVALNLATTRLGKGLGKHAIPVVVLARLAVDQRLQGAGLGALLLQDAIKRAIVVSEQIGARAIITHPISELADSFYEHYGFEKSEFNYRYLLMKDAKKVVK